MVAFVADAESVGSPDRFSEAAARNAELTAELVGSFLRTVVGHESPLSLPRNYLLELAAVLELRYWEDLGLEAFMPGDLPSSREAAADLSARVVKGPAEFEGPDAAPLSERVLRFWLEQFAWEAPNLFQSEVILGDIDEDAFADLVAEFLWEHRHDCITKLNGQKE